MARRNTKFARKVLELTLSDPAAAELPQEYKDYARIVAEGIRPLIAQQGDRATVVALEAGDLIRANLISRRADIELLTAATKEKLDMAIKSSDRTRKANAAMEDHGPSKASDRRNLGIGSRMRPLVKKAEGAVEEALVEMPPRPLTRELHPKTHVEGDRTDFDSTPGPEGPTVGSSHDDAASHPT